MIKKNDAMGEQLNVAQRNAHNTFHRITQEFPSDLAKKEEHLLGRIQSISGGALAKLEVLYLFMEELYSFVNKFTPCKKGCDYCCHYPVEVTELDIRYIERVTKIKRAPSTTSYQEFHGQPCPFLRSGSCLIYEYRPFLCRRHVNLCQTPTWCRVEKCNEAIFESLAFSEVDKSYGLIVEEIGYGAMVKDIRQVFGRMP